MSARAQPIRMFMTSIVHTIQMASSLPEARRLMEAKGIRHLPVLDGDKLVGLLSERELGRLEGFPMVNLDLVAVPDAMTDTPYIVEPSAPVLDVVQTMRDHRYGSAIVAEQGKVVGIFTNTDALGLLASLLGDEA